MDSEYIYYIPERNTTIIVDPYRSASQKEPVVICNHYVGDDEEIFEYLVKE